MKVGDLVFEEQSEKVWIVTQTSDCIGTDIKMCEIFDGEKFRFCTEKILEVISRV